MLLKHKLSCLRSHLEKKYFNNPLEYGLSPFSWIVLWSSQTVGFFVGCRVLGRREGSLRYLLEVGRMLVHFVSFRRRFLHVPELPANGFCKRTILFSAASVSDLLSSSRREFDTYYGKFSEQDLNDCIVVYSLLGKYSNKDLEELQLRGIAFMAYRRDILMPLRSLLTTLSVMVKNSCSSRGWSVFFMRPFHESEDILKTLREVVAKNPIIRCIFPYEGHPFHHGLIKGMKEKEILTVGYVHSSLHALPSFLLKRPFAPDICFVNGLANKRVLVDHCGWEEGQVKSIPSLRYTKRELCEFSGKIFLPNDFTDQDTIVAGLSSVLKSVSFEELPEVKIHPRYLKNRKHVKLKEKLEALIEEESAISKDVNSVVAVVVGSTSTIVEALESGVKEVYLISEWPDLHAYDRSLWPEIEVQHISTYVSLCTLKKFGQILCYDEGERSNILRVLKGYVKPN